MIPLLSGALFTCVRCTTSEGMILGFSCEAVTGSVALSFYPLVAVQMSRHCQQWCCDTLAD